MDRILELLLDYELVGLEDFFFHSVGNGKLSQLTDELIFSRGVGSNHQPDSY